MYTLVVSVRSACIVMGIAALGTLLSRLVGESGLRFWLLMNQQKFPGALWAASAVEHLAYGLAILLICVFVARAYWRSLFPERLSVAWFVGCFAAGLLFAMFLNHPMHVFLFEMFFGKSQFTGGAVSDSIAANIFSGLSGAQRVLTMSAFATIVLSPLVEELTDRGILFREAETLSLWKIAILSFLVFCFSHFAIGGMAKVLAVAPAAALFIAIRLKTGSFLYSATAHIAMNFAAMLKLQVF